MSAILCKKCGCLCNCDDYPEGFYRFTSDGKEIESDDYYCENCNQEEE